MKVGAPNLPLIAAQPASAATPRSVEPKRTPVSRADLRAAIARALEKVNGSKPSSNLVDVMTAQASLETASGDQMFNYNFGGIKGHSPTGETAVLKTHEVLDGKDVVIKDGFRAYRSLDDGAVDYVKTMKSRFGGAFAPAERGDAAGFAHALKSAGYYTAPEAAYAKGIERLMSAPSTSAAASPSTIKVAHAATPAPLTSPELARVDDAIDAARWMDVSSPSPSRSHHEEDEDS
jgi:flagellar protein FlgJ